jgi:hypothetical protein
MTHLVININVHRAFGKPIGVPASLGAVERMFSINGHIFNPKRRKTGIKFFKIE